MKKMKLKNFLSASVLMVASAMVSGCDSMPKETKLEVDEAELKVTQEKLAACKAEERGPQRCGQDHIFARYANLVKKLVEQNFYVNYTYTCSFAYMTPSPWKKEVDFSRANYHYRCVPDQEEYGRQGPTENERQNRPSYFNATISVESADTPIMSVRIESYQPSQVITHNYVGNDIPQPGLHDIATIEPSF